MVGFFISSLRMQKVPFLLEPAILELGKDKPYIYFALSFIIYHLYLLYDSFSHRDTVSKSL
jgi:hypothetical protein